MEKGKFSGFSFTKMIDMHIKRDIIHEDLVICDIINNSTNINKYSNAIKNFLFIYIAMNPEQSVLPNKKIMRRTHPVLELYMNVDFEKFRCTTKTKARKMLAELYLTGIKKYLSKQKDFKHELFYKDVKELFEREGIL